MRVEGQQQRRTFFDRHVLEPDDVGAMHEQAFASDFGVRADNGMCCLKHPAVFLARLYTERLSRIALLQTGVRMDGIKP